MEEVKKQEIESLFCPYKQSLALKELRFEEPCMRGWDKNGKIWYHPDSDIVLDNPTFSQAFRFFREKYGLHYIICKNIQMDGYGYREVILIPYMEENENTIFKTYEEAEVECLVKLIEIAKEQNVK